jgi:hypothetical protein
MAMSEAHSLFYFPDCLVRNEPMNHATGFDCQPLENGNVLIEFFGDHGKTLKKQIVTPEVLHSIPLVALLTRVAMEDGPKAAKKLMRKAGR